MFKVFTNYEKAIITIVLIQLRVKCFFYPEIFGKCLPREIDF